MKIVESKILFFLSQPHEPPVRVTVLAERVDPQCSIRTRLLKAQRSFRLAPREREGMEALELGMTDQQMAAALEVSVQTVRGYLKVIRAKRGARPARLSCTGGLPFERLGVPSFLEDLI